MHNKATELHFETEKFEIIDENTAIKIDGGADDSLRDRIGIFVNTWNAVINFFKGE